MSFKKCIAFLTAATLLLCALPGMAEEEALFVRRVENLPESFFLGMDVSSVLAEEASGVKYYDAAGDERDLFELLAENGVNLIRVRVWNDPFDSQGRGYGGGNCDINAAVEIGRRAAAAGLPLLVDFHYSDFWADPGKQMAPKAWKGMKIGEKAAAVEAYTQDCLVKLRDAGVSVAMVQLGNETNGQLCGEKRWPNICALMSAGSRAVREAYPGALVAVHFSNPENGDAYRSWAANLARQGLDYDVFGSSYYPFWHGSMENLKAVLSEIAETYGKKVMVMETSYAWTGADGDFSGNSFGEGSMQYPPYPLTVQGQVNAFTDVVQAMADVGGVGVCYWEGAWAPVGTASWEENSAKWEQYGSGWATSYAGEYDPNDAGKYYGGSACDNQALFDFSGHALPSLAMFNLVKTGRETALRVAALEEAELYCDINGDVVLPDTVTAVMNDNSRKEIPVSWKILPASLLKAEGPGVHVLHGKADGMEAVLNLHLVQFNYLANGSFEEDDLSMWRAVDYAGADELYAEDKPIDSMTGSRHWHFYSARANSVSFDLEQDVSDLPAGKYAYTISIQGGDAGNTTIYSYVKINGETVSAVPATVTQWNVWNTPIIEGIRVREGDLLTVGIHVQCDGAGAWGKLDDAELHSMGN